jgi:phage terminase large subunit-like protein
MGEIPPVQAYAVAQQNLQRYLGELNKRARYKFRHYFPDCTAQCNPWSSRRDDHAGLCRVLYQPHIDFFTAGARHRERLCLGGNRTGKAQPNDEPVLTPRGFVPIGSLHLGDEVIGASGAPVKVLAVFPQGKRPIVRVALSDGSRVRCDVEHLWSVRPSRAGRMGGKRVPFETVTTQVLMERLSARERFALPQRPVVQFESSDLPIDPYLLGLLLGDGHLGQGLKITTTDPEIVAYCREIALKYECELNGGEHGSITYWFGSTQRAPSGAVFNLLIDLLKGLGLFGCRSFEKRIPPIYLTASEEDRRALLAGLVDTDGYTSHVGERVFYSVSRGLCDDVTWLARSLGINASVNLKNGHYNGEAHTSWFTRLPRTRESIFRLERKRQHERKPQIALRPVMLEAIEPAGEADCTCILVDAPDHLYLTNDFVVTHNTDCASYEVTAHATGLYPRWWEGRRFETANDWWVASDSMLTTRDICQVALLGSIEGVERRDWQGMLPAHLIYDVSRKSGGVSDCIDQIWIRHVSGELSTIGFRSYDQGRRMFQGVARTGVWLDEEPPEAGEGNDIYTECLLRVLDRDGIIMATWTPLRGLTRFIEQYLSSAVVGGADAEEPAAPAILGDEEGDAA